VTAGGLGKEVWGGGYNRISRDLWLVPAKVHPSAVRCLEEQATPQGSYSLRTGPVPL
jgi:hypothetical protein